MFKVDQLRDLIIKPALHDLGMYSPEAEELLIFTCATESRGGTFLKQIKGPALGIYQMEPATYNDIWQNYIRGNSRILMILLSNFDCVIMPNEDRMVYDLRFATAMCRLDYARVPQAIPSPSDIDSLWDYYKRHYNSAQGSANKDQSIELYHTFLNT